MRHSQEIIQDTCADGDTGRRWNDLNLLIGNETSLAKQIRNDLNEARRRNAHVHT